MVLTQSPHDRTEAGLAGDTVRRAAGDDSWNYIRFYPYHRKYIHMDPLGNNQFEAIYLRGHPALMTSNSDHPVPGSWRSKDVFVPHPSIPDVWKFTTRVDDRVTLLNGEKVLPLPIEGRLREDPLIREAVVVGVDKPMPGVLIFRSDASERMSSSVYLDAIWSSVADANSRAEGFSQITRDMISVLGPEVQYPRTDKGSIIRAQVYKVFARQIESLYDKTANEEEGGLKLDVPQLEKFLLELFATQVGVALPGADTEFFAAGVDSLRAMQARRMIQSKLDLGGAVLAPNVVYESVNVRGLAKHLHSLSIGSQSDQHWSDTDLMKELVGRYSRFGDVVVRDTYPFPHTMLTPKRVFKLTNSVPAPNGRNGVHWCPYPSPHGHHSHHPKDLLPRPRPIPNEARLRHPVRERPSSRRERQVQDRSTDRGPL